MKKTLLIVSIVLVFTMVISPVFADSDNSYYLKELDLTVTIPKEFTVFTRDMKTDDPNLAKYGFTKDFLLSTMKTQHTYIEALSSDGLTEMYVAMFEDSGMSDFSTQSDATLKTMMDELMPQYASMGITMTKSELYHHSQTKFIKMYGEHPVSGMTVYTRQYSTVYNGHTYNFTMQSFSGKITSSQEKALQSVVDSAVFGKQSAGGSTSEPSKTFDYKDSKTGLKFTVPAGWKEEPLSKKRETIDVKFVSEGAAFAEIMYGSIDMWSSIPESDRAGMNRSDVNNTLFSLEDISVMMGSYSSGTTTISYNDITTVTYNGSEYFCLKANTSSSGITIPMTQLMKIDNGYIYLFQYYGDRTGENYNGFESLLKSIVYSTPQASATAIPKPTAKPTTKPTATAKPTTATYNTFNSGSNSPSYTSYSRTNNNSGLKWATIIGIALWALIPGFIAKKKGRSFWGYYFLSFVITPLVTMIITLCLKNRSTVNNTNNSDILIQNEQNRLSTDHSEESKEDATEHSSEELVENQDTVEILESAPTNDIVETPTEAEGEKEYSDDVEDDAIQSTVHNTADDISRTPNDTPDDIKKLRFCRYCGFELLENSEFCSHCGKKVR